MPRLSDMAPLDEFDRRAAQVLLRDNPKFRDAERVFVERLKQRILESGDSTMIARLTDLDEAHRAYELDPKWVGPCYACLVAAGTPLLRFLGLIDE